MQTLALHTSIFLMYKHLQENPEWPQAKEPDMLYADCYAAAHYDLQAMLDKLAQHKG
jgi:hypothetical protein